MGETRLMAAAAKIQINPVAPTARQTIDKTFAIFFTNLSFKKSVAATAYNFWTILGQLPVLTAPPKFTKYFLEINRTKVSFLD
jgi:hypothetical protein